MGKRGPTATFPPVVLLKPNYSRWGNTGQPQRTDPDFKPFTIIADGETRANRNINLLAAHYLGL